MMIDRKLENLLEKIPTNYSVTSAQLAKSLNVSVRTVRSRVADLNRVLFQHGAEIVSRPHIGYRLVVSDEALYVRFQEEIGRKSEKYVPQTSKERELYLIRQLLDTNGYLKLDDLSESLYIRRGTISADLKKLEAGMAQYGLEIERRPNYGIRLVGSEIHKRQYIIYDLLEKAPYLFDRDYEEQLQKIAQCVLSELEKIGASIPELELENLFIRIYVSLLRVRCGFVLHEESNLEPGADMDRGLELSRNIMKRVGQVFHQDMSEEEATYVAFYLVGNNCLKSNAANQNFSHSVAIPAYIQRMVSQMLQTVDDSYQLILRSNLDLWMSLCQHLISLEVRLKYGIVLRNPLLMEIMNHYMFAFVIASQAAVLLAKDWNVMVSNDEIGYLAVLFALALEKGQHPKTKKKVLLVCAAGRSSAQLLAYRLQKEFYDDIGSVEVCDRNELKQKDIARFDCIFTTIPLTDKYEKPVLELKMFLDTEDIVNARRMLGKSGNRVFHHYFRPELFWSDLDAKSWEEVIAKLCGQVGRVLELPDGFEQSVYEREVIASTDYGNLIAMPHPLVTMTEESFVAVGILQKPILWKTNEVQVVFLVSISRIGDEDLQDFYREMTDYIMNEDKIMDLIASRSFVEMEASWI